MLVSASGVSQQLLADASMWLFKLYVPTCVFPVVVDQSTAVSGRLAGCTSCQHSFDYKTTYGTQEKNLLKSTLNDNFNFNLMPF